MKHGSTKRLILCALFCALIAIGAQITIPVPYGAFTLQLLFVLLAGFLLPARDGFLTMLAYLLHRGDLPVRRGLRVLCDDPGAEPGGQPLVCRVDLLPDVPAL